MDSNLFFNQQSCIHCDRCEQHISNLLSSEYKVLDMTINYKYRSVNYRVTRNSDRYCEYFGSDFSKAMDIFEIKALY